MDRNRWRRSPAIKAKRRAVRRDARDTAGTLRFRYVARSGSSAELRHVLSYFPGTNRGPIWYREAVHVAHRHDRPSSTVRRAPGKEERDCRSAQVSKRSVIVQQTETFALRAHCWPKRNVRAFTMKQIFPVVLALIPLAAMIGACVAVP